MKLKATRTLVIGSGKKIKNQKNKDQNEKNNIWEIVIEKLNCK